MNKLRLIGPFTRLLTMDNIPGKGPVRDDQLEVIDHAGILVNGEIIEAVGPYRELQHLASFTETVEGIYSVMPGMIDVHTHICWAGSRAGDYAMRLSGKSYLEIAEQGGGIWSTVCKTREADRDTLANITARRARTLLARGTTTIEVKSGYGLQEDAEIKMLQAIAQASHESGADLVATCLAAHIKPRDFQGSARQYLEYVIESILPKLREQQLANRVDIYIDEGAFSAEDGYFYLQAAKNMGYDVVIHADQFHTGGLELAIRTEAISADHLEATKENDLFRLSASKVIPVVLPGASMGLGAGFAPARRLLDTGNSLVIASDWNPGSAPMGRLLTQACVLGVYEKLTMAETFAAVTCRAAPALKLADRGILRAGMLADFIAFPCSDHREIIYNQGGLMPGMVWKRGKRTDTRV